MKKIKLFLAAIAALVSVSGFAQTDEQYEAAIAAVTNGNYGIVAVYNNQMYVLNSSGYLTDDAYEISTFAISQKSGGKIKDNGFRFSNSTGRFTNGGDGNNVITSTTHLAQTTGDRADFECQVLYLNNEDYYAVRATNSNSTSWGASAYWTVADDVTGDYMPEAAYSFADVPYVWQFVPEANFSDVLTAVSNSRKARILAQLNSYLDDAAYMNDKSNLQNLISAIEAASTIEEIHNATDASTIATVIDEFKYANATYPYNVTNVITNPGFETSGGAGWTMEAGNKNLCGGAGSNHNAESWCSAFTLSQTVTVPNGYYKLRAQAALTDYDGGYNPADNYPVVYAGDKSVVFNSMIGDDRSSSMAKLSSSFSGGKYYTAWTDAVMVTTGSLTIGVRGTRTNTWCIWDNFQLMYLGPIDLSEYATALANAVSAAQAYETQLPAAVYANIVAVITEYNKTYDNGDDYTTAIQAINNAVTTYATADIQSAYSRYKSIRTAVLAINDGIDVSAANTAVEAATTNVAIDVAVGALRNTLASYLAGAGITDAQIDLTDALIDNAAPGITGNLDYWTNSGSPSLQSQLYEYWNVSGATTKQNIATELPVGYYTLTAIAYTRDNMKATLNAGTNTINLVGCGSVNDRSGGSSWIAQGNGNGVNELTFQLTESTSNLEIGLTADATTGDHWMCWRSFQLEYLGTAPLVLFQQQLAEAVAAANAHADALALTVPEGIKSTYTSAISTAAAKNTSIDECLQSIADIEAATAAANAAVAPYAAYLIAADDAAIVGVASETISEQNTAVVAATTAAEIEGCTAALRSAIAAITSYDITAATITNATPTSNADGWTCSEAPNAFDAGNNNAEFWNQSAVTMKQTITLPAGTYCLTVIALQRANCVGTIEAAGKTTKIVDVPRSTANSRGDAKNFFDAGNGVNTVYFTLDSEQEVTIGINADGTTDDHWTVWRSFTLTTYTEAVAASYLKPAYDEALAAAQAAKENDAYNNVTGKERTDLEAAIADEPEATIASYEEKTAALTTATAAFTAAKTNYDLFAAHRSDYLPYADASKVPVITSETTAASIITALRAWFESNALAEGVNDVVNVTSAIVNATDPTNNDGWTWSGSKNNPKNDESWTDADGTNNHSYFDGGNWSASSWTTTMSQNISLPAGRYLLTAKARAAENVTFTMAVGENTAYLPHVGSKGNVFNRGWGDAYLEFTTDGRGVTILVTASTSTVHEWFSISDFRLVRLSLNTDAYAGETEYNALNAAVEVAEAKTLGFENGQFAPYNNVDALTALAAAKAIDQTAELTNLKTDVEALTTALGTWTANDGDVDAIYNGTFAEKGTGDNPKGWTRSNNGWGQQITGLTADDNGVDEGTTTAWYYNTNGSWQYGNDGIYTMPLAADQTYVLTFKYRKHGTDGQNWMKASVTNSDNEGLEVAEFAAAENGTNFVTAKAYFTTGDAGNYILSIEQNGNAHLTDVSLVKAASATLALNEDDDYEATNRTYYEEVTMTRSIKEGYNTVCLPFNLTAEQVAAAFGTDTKVYAFSEESIDPDNVTINFNEGDGSIAANVPVLVKATSASGSQTYNGIVLKSGDAVTTGTNFDFVGTYAPMKVDAGDYFIGNGAIYKSAGSTSIKAFRAYIKAKGQVGGEVKIYIGGDDVTGIEMVNGQSSIFNGEAIYNLAGQKVNGKLPKGIYIVNGKKVLY